MKAEESKKWESESHRKGNSESDWNKLGRLFDLMGMRDEEVRTMGRQNDWGGRERARVVLLSN